MCQARLEVEWTNVEDDMRNLDFAPLYRATVGFDRVADLMDRALSSDMAQPTYPPYNIEKLDEETYRLTMAVAGFNEEMMTITVQDNVLVVAGKAHPDDEDVQYLYRGIARRAFERQFQLADFIKIGNASLENGLLRITLHREIPEAMKPRTIQISKKASPAKNKLIEHET